VAVFESGVDYDEQTSEIVFESEYTSPNGLTSPKLRDPSQVDSGPGAGSPRISTANKGLEFEDIGYQGTESKYSIPDESEINAGDLDNSVLNKTQ